MEKVDFAGVIIEGHTRGLTQNEIDTRDDLDLCEAEHANVPDKLLGLPVYHLKLKHR